jgi:hypothetical protein
VASSSDKNDRSERLRDILHKRRQEEALAGILERLDPADGRQLQSGERLSADRAAAVSRTFQRRHDGSYELSEQLWLPACPLDPFRDQLSHAWSAIPAVDLIILFCGDAPAFRVSKRILGLIAPDLLLADGNCVLVIDEDIRNGIDLDITDDFFEAMVWGESWPSSVRLVLDIK